MPRNERINEHLRRLEEYKTLCSDSRGSLQNIFCPDATGIAGEKKYKAVEVFSVEGLFVPYRVKVVTDEGSSLHLFPQREQEDPSISSATKDRADSQRPR